MATFTSSDKNTDTFIRVAGKKWNSDYTKVEGNHDIGGVEIAGVILDAGKHTNTLLEVGYEGANVDHSNNPCDYRCYRSSEQATLEQQVHV
ncbi:MAG: hypothetical protein ACLUR5_10955 [Eubacterium ventriosum]